MNTLRLSTCSYCHALPSALCVPPVSLKQYNVARLACEAASPSVADLKSYSDATTVSSSGTPIQASVTSSGSRQRLKDNGSAAMHDTRNISPIYGAPLNSSSASTSNRQRKNQSSENSEPAQGWDVLKVSPSYAVGRGGGFVSKTLSKKGRAVLASSSDIALFQCIRMLRLARQLLSQREGNMPVFQPVLLRQPALGLGPGTMAIYVSKIPVGTFRPSATMSVASSTNELQLAGAIIARIKEKGSVVLESFGRVPALISIKAVADARRLMALERMDLAVALDPVVVELTDSPDLATTVMNRFVLMECSMRDPRKLLIKYDAKLRSSTFVPVQAQDLSVRPVTRLARNQSANRL